MIEYNLNGSGGLKIQIQSQIAELRVLLVSAVSLLWQQMEDRSLWIGLTTTRASLIPARPPDLLSSFSQV